MHGTIVKKQQQKVVKICYTELKWMWGNRNICLKYCTKGHPQSSFTSENWKLAIIVSLRLKTETKANKQTHIHKKDGGKLF